MFIANYQITNSILKNIGAAEAAKEIVLHSHINSSWESKLKRQAMERSIYFGVRLEGSRLSEEDITNIIDGREVIGSLKDIQEVVNNFEALKFIKEITVLIGENSSYTLTLDTILKFHKSINQNLIPEELLGKFRARQVVIKETSTGEITYSPPPAAEVPFLMEDLLNWVNSKEGQQTHPIIKAAIIHFELFRIHPFVTGNSQVSRLLSKLILYLDKYDFKEMFCIEEYFNQDPMRYHLTLQEISNQPVLDTHERDLTSWIEYFSECFALELNKLKERIRKISTDSVVKDKLGESLELNERQMLIMEYLHRYKEMKNKDFRKIFPDHSDDTVLRELRFLRQKGLVKKVSNTKKATYVLK